MMQGPDPTSRLSIQNASKTFGRVRVLDAVDLDIHPGEIHGLIGQNGSGKSTLIKLLSGFYPADPGTEIRLDGVPLKMPVSPHELQSRGIAFVHQDLGLDLGANVIENIRIGRFDANPVTRRIRWRSEAEEVAHLLHAIGAGQVSPYAMVGSLHHAERASVAIARAMQGIEYGEGLVVFDESTQSLPRDILHEFYAQVRSIAASGTSVMIVSHRLDEVLALCDRVTILEDGSATVQGQATAGLTEAELTRLILGKSAASRSSVAKQWSEDTRQDRLALVVDGLAGAGVVDANLTVRAGEIVGVIGTSESGYDALPYLLAGTRRATTGSIQIGETTVSARTMNPRRAIDAGLCLVPGDRGGQGVARDLGALENLTLPRVVKRGRPWAIGQRWQREEFGRAVRTLGVTPPNAELVLGSFSGGNQQKLLLAKWLLNDPQVLVLHEPTQAVDVGAREDILRELRRQAAHGVAIVISSLETTDLASVCDRVLVMKDGRVTRELVGDEIESHHIIDAVYTGISTEISNAKA